MNECKLVEDLLPLYAEDLVSEESADFIREHCTGCEQCRKLLRRSEEVIPMKTDMPNYKKALKRDRTQILVAGALIMLMLMGLLAAAYIVCRMPQKLEEEPIILKSPDGVHSVTMQPYTSSFGINEGMYATWKSDGGISEGSHWNWMEILDAQWSPDGTDLFLAIRMKSGETRMEIWYHDYGETVSRGGYFPYMTKNGWDYDDLSAECTRLLTQEGKLVAGWNSITYEFIAWGEDSSSAHLRYTTDNGQEETTCFGFDFVGHKLWIIE